MITESKNKPLLIVDCQPAYHQLCSPIMKDLCKFINGQTGKIGILFNGQLDEGTNSKQDVIDYFIKFGLDDTKINSIIWIEKNYGFFRNWIDAGFSRKVIIEVFKEMNRLGKRKSSDLDSEWLDSITPPEVIDYYGRKLSTFDDIKFPDLVSISILKKFNNCYICGGVREQCLEEIEIIMNTFNIKYTEINKFIYEL